MSLPDDRWFPIVERWIFLTLMLVSGLAWGLKLESRIDGVMNAIEAINTRLTDTDKAINRGILPVTEERISRMAKELSSIAVSLQDLQAKCDQTALEIERMKIVWARIELDHARKVRSR